MSLGGAKAARLEEYRLRTQPLIRGTRRIEQGLWIAAVVQLLAALRLGFTQPGMEAQAVQIPAVLVLAGLALWARKAPRAAGLAGAGLLGIALLALLFSGTLRGLIPLIIAQGMIVSGLGPAKRLGQFELAKRQEEAGGPRRW